MTISEYLSIHKIPVATFAAQIGVTVQTLYKYRSGEKRPSHRAMSAIAHETGGAVMPNDLVTTSSGSAS